MENLKRSQPAIRQELGPRT